MAATSLADVWNTSETSESPGSLDEPPLQSFLLYKLSQYVWNYVPPVIVLLGNFGNIMTIVIMQRMKSGGSTINMYFTALAVVDLITLDMALIHLWVGYTFRYWLMNEHTVYCKIHIWIVAQITTTSAYFLVCMTVHRAISVVWPHRVNLMCTRRRVFILLTVIAVLVAAIYSHRLYGHAVVFLRKPDIYHCKMKSESYGAFVKNVFYYIQLVIYSLLPFACLVLANGVLVWKLRTSVKEADQQFAAGRGEVSEARQKTAKSVTATIVCVSIAFIVLTAPLSIYQAIYFVDAAFGRLSNAQYAEYSFIFVVFFMLFYSNHAFNFYLYCLTGKRFREEFINIFRGRKVKG
ncbi:hypothetical protein ACOMHN_006278 [Nucella lapillus]